MKVQTGELRGTMSPPSSQISPASFGRVIALPHTGS
jgi:hypothetical protein